MTTFKQTLLLFIIIIVEGYVVLSTELLAIRQTIPYVGSGTDTVSVIIAAVLMPLAFGYQNGGRFKPHKFFGMFLTIRKKLIFNILVASIILLVGMSYQSVQIFFVDILPNMGVYDRIVQITLYTLIFLVVPVYLLGQTVPLISNFFSKKKLSSITGKMLFFSTVGSFLGAVFSTLVLMSTIGVHHTVSLNFVLLAILVIMLSRHKLSKSVILSVGIALIAMVFNSDFIMRGYAVREYNEYNRIQTTEKDGKRFLFLNRNASSMYTDEGNKFDYIEFAERLLIEPIKDSPTPRDILIIGSGGFTFGHNYTRNNFTYIDIDEDLLAVAERYILKEPLQPNKTFVPRPARAFLNETDQKFDVIYLDAYLGGASIPEHLVTEDFFREVKARLKDGGALMSNMILSPHFNNAFSRNIDNTFRAIFPHVSRHVIPRQNTLDNDRDTAKDPDNYNLWSESEGLLVNVAYIYKHHDDYDLGSIYTDNKNTVFIDKPKKFEP